MIDSHVHVGWYIDGYHSPKEVWQSEQEAGIDDICVSSTSTCAELYKLVVREMRELVRMGGSRVHPILWLTPRMLKTWGIRYMLRSKVKWQGVKMHWEAHHEWFYNKRLVEDALRIVRRLHVPLLLHTGEFKECHAAVFENIIAANPDILFVLAHGRPLDEAIGILCKYENVYVDTAFMNAEDAVTLVKAGLTDKILFGTDAPINLLYFKDIDTATYIRQTANNLKDGIGDKNFKIISEKLIYYKQ